MSDENQPMKSGASDEIQPVKASWTSVQVYAMSAVCLLVGVTVGYLYRGSTSSQPPAAPAAVVQQEAQQQAQMPPAMNGEVPQRPPSPDQLKQMADKKVAPLLEELNKNPKDTDMMIKIGTFYMAAQQFPEAQKYFQRAVDTKPTPDAWTKLSNSQFYCGEGEKALASLSKALAIDPKFANALYNQGMLKWRVQNDAKGAIASWEKLVKTNPNHPQIEQVKEMIGRAKEHEKMPTKAAAGDPPN